MIGIGVGIDYALFIVTRYREVLHERARARGRGRACHRHGRSGRACSPGCTVVISLLGMFLMGVLVRPRPRGRLRRSQCCLVMAGLDHAAARAARLRRSEHRPVRASPAASERKASSRRRSGTAGAAPCSGVRGRRFIGGLVILLLLAVAVLLAPARHRRRRQRPDDLTRPAAPTTCSPTGFGPGFNGPLLVVADLQGGHATQGEVEHLREALAQTPGVALGHPVHPEPRRRRRVDPGRTRRPRRRTKHDEARPPPARRRRARGDEWHRPDGLRRRRHRGVRATSPTCSRPRLPLVHRSRARLSFLLLMVVFRSIARAAQGRDHEPAVDRRRVRRDRRDLPVGLAERHLRRRQGGPDRGVGCR